MAQASSAGRAFSSCTRRTRKQNLQAVIRSVRKRQRNRAFPLIPVLKAHRALLAPLTFRCTLYTMVSNSSTKTRIGHVAARILDAEGADAVTMRRVAVEAGVSPMATYKHYPNRAALLNSVAENGFAAMIDAWDSGAPEYAFEVRLCQLLDQLLDFALGHQHLYRFLMFDRRDGARRFPTDFKDDPSPTFQPVLELVEEAIEAGELLDDDPLEMTLVLTSSAQGLIHLFVSGRMDMSELEFRKLCRRTIKRAAYGLVASP